VEKISTKCSFLTFLDSLLITILIGRSSRDEERDLEREREPDLERERDLEREDLEEEEEEDLERDFPSPFFTGLGEREEDLDREREPAILLSIQTHHLLIEGVLACRQLRLLLLLSLPTLLLFLLLLHLFVVERRHCVQDLLYAFRLQLALNVPESLPEECWDLVWSLPLV